MFKSIPSIFNQGASLQSLGLNSTNRRAFPGYNNMIGLFWTHVFQSQAIRDLDYFWRLDHACMLQSRVGVDIFHYIEKRNLKYGCRAVTTEDVRHVTNAMLVFF